MEILIGLGVALAVGLIIGLQREQAGRGDVSFIGGARTIPLFSLGGAVSMLLVKQLGPWVFMISFAGFMAFVAISYADTVRRHDDHGLTTESAFVMAFLLGALALADGVVPEMPRRLSIVASTAVVVTLLLSMKEDIHKIAHMASKDDVVATLKFLIVAVVVLPLLPNDTFGPLDVLNPFKIGIMIVLIAGVSFVGFVLSRVLGAGRGLGITGLVGGLVSSTAVTLSFSARAKEQQEIAAPAALAVILASTVMAARVLVMLAVVNANLLRLALFPIGGMLAAGLIASALVYRRSKKGAAKTSQVVELKNPFELSAAIKFGLAFGVVLFLSKATVTYLGSSGTYLMGLFAGSVDVDAVTISMADLSKGSLDAHVAATTVGLAAASNTIVKGSMAFVLGGAGMFRKLTLVAFGGMLLASSAGIAVMRLAL